MLVLSSSLDREVQAHKHFTGATNIYWLNELMRYVRSEGLLNSFRLYPMVARTNYGTGTTVRGLGKLTGNQMTLVNGPTWGASGIEFASASSQYGTIADFLDGGGLTAFCRLSLTDATPSADQMMVAQDETGARGFYLAVLTTGQIRLLRSGYGVVAEANDSATGAAVIADTCYVAEWIDSGGRNLYKNKTSTSLPTALGTPQTTIYNNATTIYAGARDVANFIDGTYKALAFLTGSVTTTQREQITDLINAL